MTEHFHLPRFRRMIPDSGFHPRLGRMVLEWVEFGLIRPVGDRDRDERILRALITNDLKAFGEYMMEGPVRSVAFLIKEAPQPAFFHHRALDNWPLYLAAKRRQNEQSLNYALHDIPKGVNL